MISSKMAEIPLVTAPTEDLIAVKLSRDTYQQFAFEQFEGYRDAFATSKFAAAEIDFRSDVREATMPASIVPTNKK